MQSCRFQNSLGSSGTPAPGRWKYRKFTGGAAVKLRYLVKKHADHIANGEAFVDSCDGGVVLACVFYSLPTKVLSGGFAGGRVYERGVILWIREQSGCC
jgi:hypothetical protein